MAEMQVCQFTTPRLISMGKGTSNCLCPLRHRGKSGRRELSPWHLTYWDPPPVQLRVPSQWQFPA